MGLRSLTLWLVAFALGTAGLAAPPARADSTGTFTLRQVLGYPFVATIASSDGANAIAWALDERGVRNVWIARGPDYRAVKLTSNTADDGQEIANLLVSRDGRTVVYTRGGDHDANWSESLDPDPAANPVQQFVQVWSIVPADGTSAPKLLGNGDSPAISPDGKTVAFVRDGAVWSAPADGSSAAKQLFFDRGQASDLQWSPSGDALAFVSGRGDHGFIGIYTNAQTPIRYMAPSTDNDFEPRWSPDGTRIAFSRLPGDGGPPQDILKRRPQPWSIWVARVADGTAGRVWQSPETLRGSFPDLGGIQGWGAGDRIVFVSEMDDWEHLYSVPASGGPARLLTPGPFMVERAAMTPDGSRVVFSANTGTAAGDGERRHIFSADVAGAGVKQITAGASSEWDPVTMPDGRAGFAQATAQQPAIVTLADADGTLHPLDAAEVPADFPSSQLVTPRAVTFRSSDGWLIHGQLFEPPGARAKRPGVVFVHGGPSRQMLLTWHYMDYYANAYAVNQYLANHGIAVLSVNYRLGIGYGHDFHYPPHWGPTGAAEYRDVLAAAAFLQRQPGVDARRIGIWGGSYGGYLTALALARNSNVFKAGVDFHGVHDWSLEIPTWFGKPVERYQMPDTKAVMKIAWESSPDSAISTWRSPVLLVQGDDDRNVDFHQTVDLVQRLRQAHVPFDQIVIPNEIHFFLRYAPWLEADQATADYLQRHLAP